MKWIQSGLGLHQLEAEWLNENERIIRTGNDIAVITERILRAHVDDVDDEADIRKLVEDFR